MTYAESCARWIEKRRDESWEWKGTAVTMDDAMRAIEAWMRKQVGPTWFRTTYSNLGWEPKCIAWVERCGYLSAGQCGATMAEAIMKAIKEEPAK